MRVLFITNYHQLYGANRSLLSIVEKFKKSGDDVCVFLPRRGDYSEELDKKNIKKQVIPYYSQLYYYRKSLPYLAVPILDLFSFCMLPYIIYCAKKYNPDLIYSNTAAENIGITVAKFLGVKHISHIREFMDLDHRLHFFGGAKAKKNYICKSDAVIYVSKAVAQHTLQSETLPPTHKVIYNGVQVNANTYQSRKLPININFGIVGLLDESKGQDIAIKYFDKIKLKFPGSKLHIWGDKVGAYKNSLIKMVEEMGLQELVVFHGFEKNPDVIYGSMDALLMCSKAEGFGRVTVEAMMRGIPVLGYNSGGTAEIVKDGYSGYVFSTEDEFISGVEKLFSSDEHYDKICGQAYLDSRENFSENKYTNEVKAFVDKIMNK